MGILRYDSLGFYFFCFYKIVFYIGIITFVYEQRQP